jgi:hypothetical protein
LVGEARQNGKSGVWNGGEATISIWALTIFEKIKSPVDIRKKDRVEEIFRTETVVWDTDG